MKTTLLLVRFVLLAFFCLIQAKLSLGQDTTIIQRSSNGQPRSFEYTRPVPHDILKDRKAFLKKQLNTPPETDYYLYKSEKDPYGNTHEKYQQTFRGIKVEGNEFIVHINKDGEATSSNGDYDSIPAINITPKISFDQAILQFMSSRNIKQYQLFRLPAELKDGKLLNKVSNDYELVIIKADDGQYQLAYKVNIVSEERATSGLTYINASNGKLIFCQPDIKDTNTPGTTQTLYSGSRTITGDSYGGSYRLRETGRNGTVSITTLNFNRNPAYFSSDYSANIPLATDFTDNDNNWTAAEHATNYDQAALDAHWGAEMTVDFFYTKFARNSFNNQGGEIKNYVHVKSRDPYPPNIPINMENAYWSDTYKSMFYGDGASGYSPVVGLDIGAHEIGHGVCFAAVANGLGLKYQGESGALNESLSDMWGASVENWATTGKQTWRIGEDRDGVGFRVMSNPNLSMVPQPNTYNGTYWTNVVGCSPDPSNDNCYVHRNNGVGNFWFYLLSMGGSGTNDLGNNYNVSGIGIDNAAKIVYQMENFHLTYNSSYLDARGGSITAAKEIFGAGSCQEIAVTNAWHAVGVGAAYNVNDLMSNWSPNICTNQSFTLNGPAVTSWSVNPTNIATLTTSGNSASLSRIMDGSLTLTANFTGCGLSNSSVSKSIKVGLANEDGKVTGFSSAYPNSAYYYDFGIIGYPYDHLTWSVPAGWSIDGISGSRVYVTTGNNGGSVVAYFNSCGGVARYRYMNVIISSGGTPPPALQLAPNPANNILNISFSSNNNKATSAINKQIIAKEIKEVKIFDKLGNMVMLRKFNSSAKVTLDVSALQPDVYIISASDDGINWTSQKLIINHTSVR